MGRPTLVGAATSSTKATGPSLVVARPDGLADGDLLVAVIRDSSAGLASDYSAAGFTRRGPAFQPSDPQRVNTVLTKPVASASSEPASYTFAAQSSGARGIAILLALRGADPSSPVSASAAEYSGSAISNGRRASSVTPPAAGSLALFVASAEFSAGVDHAPASTPSGMSAVAAVPTGAALNVSRTYTWVGRQDVEAQATGDKDISWAGSPAGASAQMLVFGPGPDQPQGLAVEATTAGGAVPGRLHVWTGAAEVPALDVLALPRRTYTTTEHHADLAVPGRVRWGHRGASANFSEMTMRGYTNAIWHGCDVVEASCWRTSDGVFAMVHDNDLSISTVGSGPVTSQAWDSMQGLSVDVPTAGGVLGRLEELLSTYGQSKVVLVEDKQNTQQAALRSVVEAAYPSAAVAREHVIVKVYGSAGGLATGAQWASWGYRTWAYMYDADILSLAPSAVSPISYLGINWNATQANYDAMLATGKPLVAHVVSTQAQVDTALARGAVGLQVANVLALVPRVNSLP